MTKRASEGTTHLGVWFVTSFELRRTFELCEAVAQSLQSTKASALFPMDRTMALPEDDIEEEMVHKGPQS